MKIGVIGTGHVGLVVVAGLAHLGHEVFCTDSNLSLLSNLKQDQMPFFEPGLEEMIRRNSNRIQYMNSVKSILGDCENIFISVGTPENEDGSTNLDPLWTALREICTHAQNRKAVILKSTVPMGTATKALSFIREHSQISHLLISNPEFLRQGEALEDFLKPDRIVIGAEGQESFDRMLEIYEPLLKTSDSQLLCMDNTSAELVKYASNSFLALKVSFINEMALLCERIGANIHQVQKGLTSDHRINPHFFNPGLGYGGSCFPKDLRSLQITAQNHELKLFTVAAAEAANERQKGLLFEKLKHQLGLLQGKQIGILGLSYKSGTDDIRRAPAIELIENLFSHGAQVRAFDPVAMEGAKKALGDKVQMASTKEEAASGADALLIVTDWPEFHTLNLVRLKKAMKSPLVIDGRNIFDAQKMSSLGFTYLAVGLSPRPPSSC